jgi:alcohol dehydrogenase
VPATGHAWEAYGKTYAWEGGQTQPSGHVVLGGVIANIGVHGVKADLHLESLWDRNIAITTRLVDTVSTPMLLKTVRSGRLDPARLITHRFQLENVMNAYETFGGAADSHAFKVIIEMS